MSSSLHIPEREAQAKREIGVTRISPIGKRMLLAAGVILILLTTLTQLLIDPSELKQVRSLFQAAQTGWEKGSAEESSRLFSANRHLLEAMHDWEDNLEDSAWFRDPLLKRIQPLLWRLGSGNGQAVRGREDWLLYQPDVDYVIQKPFDYEAPQHTLVDFRNQLAKRGIKLLLVPVPVKPQIHPEALSRVPVNVPLRNPSEIALFAALEEAGVESVDLADLFANARTAASPLYLKTDTHWTPEAMRLAAEHSAQRLVDLKWVPLDPPSPVQWTRQDITHHGDIVEMLSLPSNQTLIEPETISHTRVEFQSGDSPRVLLLGDSFSNIFSLEAMGWGEQGGFAEHLGAALRQPVRSLVRNDAGASATRELLVRELSRGNDPLEGVEVVVWQFASREFRFGNWVPLHLPEQAASSDADSNLLKGTRSLTVTATVAKVSPIPRPGTVAYSDHVATVHLRELSTEDGEIQQAQAVARFLSMQNQQLLPPARWRPGMRVRLRLIPFSEVEKRYGTLNTSELDELDLMLATPFWIEEVQP
jgi:alginate O-acetyltransferase complex protein AlgJ